MPNSRVAIKGIRGSGRLGANEGEQSQPQEVLVDVDALIEYTGDSIDETIDYRFIVDLVRETVESTSFLLLESLADAVASALFEYQGVLEARVAVHKPSAAAELGVEDVSAEAILE